MTDLKPITALGNAEPMRRAIGYLELTEIVTTGLASLALSRATIHASILGLELPAPGKWASSGEISAFWTGPNQWMIEGEGRGTNDFVRYLNGNVLQGALTDQTDGWVTFEVRSLADDHTLVRLMEKLFNIDLARFVTGSATRTGLEHMSVFVIRKAPDRLVVMGMRSAAGSIWHALETAASRVSEKSK